MAKELRKEQEEAEKIRKKISVMEENIPNAMSGEYPLSLDELVTLIKKQKESLEQQEIVVKEKELAFQNAEVSVKRLGRIETEDTYLAGGFPKCRWRGKEGFGESTDSEDRSEKG